MASLKVETGVKTYDIEDETGNVTGTIRINTTDINMLNRAKETQANIQKIVDDMKNINADDVEKLAEITEKTDKAIKNEINVLFDDENLSKAVFGNQSCLNTLNGVTFVERFLNVVMPVIYADFGKEHEKSMELVNKYTSQVK